MTILNFFKKTSFDKTFIIGYYGACNFGDELILEYILLTLKKYHPNEKTTIYYKNPSIFHTLHPPQPHTIINEKNIFKIIKTLLTSNHIIIGGGGLWSRDSNKNIFLLSIILYNAKYLLRKKISLIGVGYYTSTNYLGAISAYLAGKSAQLIIARDQESKEQFERINQSTVLEQDIVPALRTIHKTNKPLTKKEEAILPIKSNTVLITLRHMIHTDNYNKTIIEVVTSPIHSQTKFIILDIELTASPIHEPIRKQLQHIAKKQTNISYKKWEQNPILLVRLLQEKSEQITLISPQYHTQLIAHYTNVKFLPLSYDNKCTQLLNSLGYTLHYDCKNITAEQISSFITPK